jgi:hypothetical protein
MLMIVVVIVFFVRMVEGGRRLGRLRFGLVFDGVGRTQRFAFQARYAPNKCHSGLETALFLLQTAAWGLLFKAKPASMAGRNILSHGKRDCWQGQTAGNSFAAGAHRGRHVTVRRPGAYERT